MRTAAIAVCALVAAAGLLSGQARPQPAQIKPPRQAAARQTYQPVTREERIDWVADASIGPRSLATGALSAAWGNLWNLPPEYGRTPEGLGKRYAIRLYGVATGNAIEAGLGAIWGEDPRYIRSQGLPFWRRVRYVLKMTFFAYRPDGSVKPAYARWVGTAGNNFLTWPWRVPSDQGVGPALVRTGWGFAGRAASHALTEFWPDLKRLLPGRKKR